MVNKLTHFITQKEQNSFKEILYRELLLQYELDL